MGECSKVKITSATLFLILTSSFAFGGKEQIKMKYFENELQMRQINASIYTYNLQIKKNLIKRTTLDSEKQILDYQTTELAEKIKTLSTEQIKIKKALFQRLKAMNDLKGEGLFNIIMSAQSAHDMDMYARVMSQVLKKDRTLWLQYEKNKKKLIANQQSFLNKLSLLNQKKSQVEKEEKQIQDLQSQKILLLSEMRKNQSKLMKRIIASQETDLFNISLLEKKGTLEMPVNGQIIQKYGLIKSQSDDVVFKNNGVWIQPFETQGVKVVFPGKVAFVGNVDGFGKTIIIDHGDHFYTTYSGQYSSELTEGQAVQTGQFVAETNANIYFEIRHFSESYDPQKWLKGNPL